MVRYLVILFSQKYASKATSIFRSHISLCSFAVNSDLNSILICPFFSPEQFLLMHLGPHV